MFSRQEMKASKDLVWVEGGRLERVVVARGRLEQLVRGASWGRVGGVGLARG